MFCLQQIKWFKPNGYCITRISFSGSSQLSQQNEPGAKLPTKKHLRPVTPKLRYPLWFLKKERANYNERLTAENKLFVNEIIKEKYGPPAIISGISTYQLKTPLKKEPLQRGEWMLKTRRTGLIARKIGIYPMWTKEGRHMLTTLLQVVDNHVVSYTPPEEYTPHLRVPRFLRENEYGCLLVGAESMDPQMYTKQYTGLFNKAGLMPKRVLARFMVSPEAAIQPGTPLYASHYRPGDVVDIRGTTINRGFQGVMKRWGFKGMPATHGVTKTHRRPGNIGGGNKKAGVWLGTKMPGNMGLRKRIHRGVKILRINTKYNVIWVKGNAVPGETNSVVYIYDTLLPLKKFTSKPPGFPTHFPEEDNEPLPEELYDDSIHYFENPSITYEVEEK
ncbi:mitochondrial ribosomal protein L3 [Lycorma delicatula]|uniref:mitochondrial ribosomal protein L3 n=1 Tax=Lycorma delicatula TaxID=130591 RepID=UPI003F5164F3